MTVEEINNIYYINKEIDKIQKELYDLKTKNKSMGKRYSVVLKNLLKNGDITIDEVKKFEDDYKAS